MNGLEEYNSSSDSRTEQLRRMFDKTDELFHKYGAVFRDELLFEFDAVIVV